MTIAVVLFDLDWHYVAHRVMPCLTAEQAHAMSAVEIDALAQGMRKHQGQLVTHGLFIEFEGDFDPTQIENEVRAGLIAEAKRTGYTS